MKKRLALLFTVAIILLFSGNLYAPPIPDPDNPSPCSGYTPPDSFAIITIKYVSKDGAETYLLCFKGVGSEEPSLYTNTTDFQLTPVSPYAEDAKKTFMEEEVGINLHGNDKCYSVDIGDKDPSDFDGSVTNMALKISGEPCFTRVELNLSNVDYTYLNDLCASDPSMGDCDLDGDGIVNRMDPCPEDAEIMKVGGKEAVDGYLDGCPNSTLGQPDSGNKIGSRGQQNQLEQPGNYVTYPSNGFLAGESSCSLVENSRITFVEVIFMLIPFIALGLGYITVPARIKNRFKNNGHRGRNGKF